MRTRRGPFPLAYHGWGDVFVFVFFGLVAVPGTFYVQGADGRSGGVVGGHPRGGPWHGPVGGEQPA